MNSAPETPIHLLKNLGPVSCEQLARIGIHTKADLAEMGAIPTWQALRANGWNVNIIALYALAGALIDCHWNKLPADLKLQLQTESKI
jgi:DNA transformation protein